MQTENQKSRARNTKVPTLGLRLSHLLVVGSNCDNNHHQGLSVMRGGVQTTTGRMEDVFARGSGSSDSRGARGREEVESRQEFVLS